jgi:hypothetical protein
MRLFSYFTKVCGVVLLAGCASNEPSNSDGTTSSSTGDTSSTGGTGGSGTGSGSTTSVGGAGGMTPTGPCDDVPADTQAIVFSAPTEHGDGLVGISAFIDCPQPADPTKPCTPVSWSDPFVGCVAAADVDTIVCLFGTRPPDAEIVYIAALYPSESAPANAWFSNSDGVNTIRLGTHVACIGTEVVGAFDGTSFTGALLPDPDKPQNYKFTVPSAE